MSGVVIPERVYSTQFWMLCVSSLLFFASFNMIIPELPAYLASLGGAQYKGLIISLFTLTAMISRPFSGKLADTVGRVPVMMVGVTVCFICSLIYPLLTAVSGFLLLRLVHGFSTGFSPTGVSAYLSDIIPPDRRGEAMGIMGTAGSIGMASGPALGGFITAGFGINAMFYTSSFCALVSIAVFTGIKETLVDKQRFSISLLKVRAADLFEPLVWPACIVMALTSFTYGSMLTLLPDLGQYMGIQNKGILFAFLTIASLIVRLVAGKASDRYGRTSVMMVTATLIVVAMIVMGLAHTPLMVIVGVTIYGFGQGSASPTLLAWATDLSAEHHKGRGIASLYIFMEFGIGMGALLAGLIYDNQPARFVIVFAVCASLSVLALLYLLWTRSLKITS